MISKELLSKVFNEKVLSYNVINKTEIIVQFVEHDEVINVHELAHKCKEWANLKGYGISTHILIKQKLCDIYPHNYSTGSDDTIAQFEAETEHESIFKACEWIMENTK